MFNGTDVTMQPSQIHPQPQTNANASSAANSSNSTNSYRRSAFVKIIEQPASKALRFRYECEGRSAGSIPGVLSSPENKTFPSIQVVGYRGRAVVVGEKIYKLLVSSHSCTYEQNTVCSELRHKRSTISTTPAQSCWQGGL